MRKLHISWKAMGYRASLDIEGIRTKQNIMESTDSSLTGNMIYTSVLKSICWIGKQQRDKDIANTSATVKLVLNATEEKNALANP